MSDFPLPFRCPFCGEQVDPTARNTMQRVHGWQQRAGTRVSGKHGGSDIYLRRTVDEFAHPHCVRAARSGRLNQETLL